MGPNHQKPNTQGMQKPPLKQHQGTRAAIAELKLMTSGWIDHEDMPSSKMPQVHTQQPQDIFVCI